MARLTALFALLCPVGASCSLRPPFATLTVDDPQGYASESHSLAIGFEQGPAMRSVPRHGVPFPLTVTVTAAGSTEALVFVEARDATGAVLARGAATVALERHSTRTTAVLLGRPCDGDAECDDGVFCNGREACQNGACRAQPAPCGTSFACVQSLCVELSGGTGECKVSVDHAVCEVPGAPTRYCDTTLGCVPGDPCLDDETCDDGYACNGVERCVAFHCTGGAIPNAEDGDPCTTDGCNDERAAAGLGPIFHVTDPMNDGNQCGLSGSRVGVCSASRGGCVDASCGDGIVTSSRLETCDDANTQGGDGCDELCQLEPGWSCAGEPTICTSVCGDQLRVGTEECDGGVNSDLCDGCRSNCTLVPGFGCGDGIVCGNEACDLGTADNDGSYGGCDPDCSLASFCGDGAIDPGQGELCDDGGALPLDGCNGACQIELGFQCSGTPSSCAPICGDYIVTGGEACDEGPLGEPCSNCRADCTLVPGFGCGDGYVCGSEACDLGAASNTGAYGGCTMLCAKAPHCGDSLVQSSEGEACDLGLLNSTSAGSLCSPSCQRQYWVLGNQVGLQGRGSLTLKLNGGSSLPVSSDLLFTLPTPLTNGASYQAVIETVSLSLPGHCQLRHASGVISGRSATSLISECYRRVASVRAGAFHTCAILVDGTVRCWGIGGQLGIGDAFPRGGGSGEMGPSLPPVSLGAGRTALLISAGTYSTCALLDTQAVKCWGFNYDGQLGLGDTLARGDEPNEMGDSLPALVLGTGRVAMEVAVGFSHACARLDDGTVKCWGSNGSGQLGLGDFSTRGDQPNEMGDALFAVSLGMGRTAVRIYAGSSSSCASLDDNSLKCWGSVPGTGPLGTTAYGDQPNEMGDNLPVVALGSGRTAVEVAIGDRHFCARLDNGSVKCWGNNVLGQLGLGDLLTRGDDPNEMGDNLPTVSLGAGRTAVQIGTGKFFSCARLDNGQIKCWGRNDSGQLGLGDTSDRGAFPSHMGDNLNAVNLGAGRTATHLTVGADHACAQLDNGVVKCWGRNSSGQLGLGDFDHRGTDSSHMGDALSAPNTGW